MSNIRLHRNLDGTLATRGRLAAQNYATRIAVASQFVGKTVEIELWNRYGGEPTVVWGQLVTAALGDGGTTRDLVVVVPSGELLPVAYSGARVLSISELSEREIAERVHTPTAATS